MNSGKESNQEAPTVIVVVAKGTNEKTPHPREEFPPGVRRLVFLDYQSMKAWRCRLVALS